MVDEVTRYYMRKQNLALSDEFHEQVIPSDVDVLSKASFYMMVAPVVTTAIVFGYSKMREEGGFSSHFAHAIRRAKNRFTPSGMGETGGKWPSKKPGKRASLADLDLEPSDYQKSRDTISGIYKQMKIEKQDALE